MASRASNLGPTNQVLIDRVQATVDQIARDEGVDPSQIPADAVYTSTLEVAPDDFRASARPKLPGRSSRDDVRWLECSRESIIGARSASALQCLLDTPAASL
jgi:hypothetical protein